MKLITDHREKAANYSRAAREEYQRGRDFISSVFAQAASREKAAADMLAKHRKQWERGY